MNTQNDSARAFMIQGGAPSIYSIPINSNNAVNVGSKSWSESAFMNYI